MKDWARSRRLPSLGRGDASEPTPDATNATERYATRVTALSGGCTVKLCETNGSRHIHEAARDVARAIAKTAAYEQTRRDRKKVEMLFAHLKRILRMGRLRLRGPAGAQF